MKRRISIGFLFLLAEAGCGGPRGEPLVPRPMGAREHYAEAERQDREAAGHDAAAARLRGAETDATRCYDTPAFAPDPTSGGERIPVLRPCWTGPISPALDQAREAAEHRRSAAGHRAQAQALWRAERIACAGLGEEERSNSPFSHRSDVLAVTPLNRDGRLVGARVRFRRVPGLDAPWLRRAVACHQARAQALGYSPTVMAYCPLMVGPTTAEVAEDGTGLTVELATRDAAAAAAILGRAEHLLAGR